jgi:hypothetical protein
MLVEVEVNDRYEVIISWVVWPWRLFISRLMTIRWLLNLQSSRHVAKASVSLLELDMKHVMTMLVEQIQDSFLCKEDSPRGGRLTRNIPLSARGSG